MTTTQKLKTREEKNMSWQKHLRTFLQRFTKRRTYSGSFSSYTFSLIHFTMQTRDNQEKHANVCDLWIN